MKGGLPGLATSSHNPRFATGHRFVIVSLYFAATLSDGKIQCMENWKCSSLK